MIQVQQVFSFPPASSGLPFLSAFSLMLFSVYYGDAFIRFLLYLLFRRLSHSSLPLSYWVFCRRTWKWDVLSQRCNEGKQIWKNNLNPNVLTLWIIFNWFQTLLSTARHSLLLCHRLCSQSWISKMRRISSEIRQNWTLFLGIFSCANPPVHTHSQSKFSSFISTFIKAPSFRLRSSTCWPCPVFFFFYTNP